MGLPEAYGAPAEMLNHREIRMHEPELVSKELGRRIDGGETDANLLWRRFMQLQPTIGGPVRH